MKKFWKFESPNFIIETNLRAIGIEAINLFTKDTLEDLGLKIKNPQKSFQDYIEIKKGENSARHFIYENITKKEIENIEKHIKKVSIYFSSLKQFTFLNLNIENYIIIDYYFFLF